MSIQFSCTDCNKPIEVDDELAGLAARCPFCDTVVTVPEMAAAPPPLAHPVAGEFTSPTLTAPSEQSPAKSSRAGVFAAWGWICIVLAFGLGFGSALYMVSSLPFDTDRLETTEQIEQQSEKLQEFLTDNPGVMMVMLAMMAGAAGTSIAAIVLFIISLRTKASSNWGAIIGLIVSMAAPLGTCLLMTVGF